MGLLYTIIEVITYVICGILALLIAVNIFTTKKIMNKISGAIFLLILLMRLFSIR